MATAKDKTVKCRFPKCSKLHDSTDLLKSEAVMGGNKQYYHPDCYHVLQTVTQIRDTFVKDINPTLTAQQIGALVSIVYNLIFVKKVDVDFIKFALDYHIKYKPGVLKYPGGIHYAIQNNDVLNAWNKYKEQELRQKIKEEAASKISSTNKSDDFDVSNSFVYKPQSARSFADILH